MTELVEGSPLVEVGTGETMVNKEVFDELFQFVKDMDANFVDVYVAVETLGAVMAKALGIPRIVATVEDEDE